MKALALVALATLLATPAFADSMTKEAIDKVQLQEPLRAGISRQF